MEDIILCISDYILTIDGKKKKIAIKDHYSPGIGHPFEEVLRHSFITALT